MSDEVEATRQSERYQALKVGHPSENQSVM